MLPVRCLVVDDWKVVSAGDKRRLIFWDLESIGESKTLHRQPSLVHCLWASDTRVVTASPDMPAGLAVLDFDHPLAVAKQLPNQQTNPHTQTIGALKF